MPLRARVKLLPTGTAGSVVGLYFRTVKRFCCHLVYLFVYYCTLSTHYTECDSHCNQLTLGKQLLTWNKLVAVAVTLSVVS